MADHGGGGWRPSAATVTLVPIAVGLAGNLATGTVAVSWRWWPLTTWVLVGAGVLVSVLVETARLRADRTGPDAPDRIRVTDTGTARAERGGTAVSGLQDTGSGDITVSGTGDAIASGPGSTAVSGAARRPEPTP